MGNTQVLHYNWTISLNPTVQASAAVATAQNNVNCVGGASGNDIRPFYWELGNATSPTPLASGSVTAPSPSPSPIYRTTLMDIDSASKFIFGTYAIELLAGTPEDPLTNSVSRNFLRMASGYTSFQDEGCDANYSTNSNPLVTVLECYNSCCALNASGAIDSTLGNAACAVGLSQTNVPAGDTLSCNNTYTASTAGTFYYNGGHFQRFAVAGTAALENPADGYGSVGFQMGSLIGSSALPDHLSLEDNVLAELGQTGLSNLIYNFPQMAGGINTNAAAYATVLQSILSGSLEMYDYLGTNQICAWKGKLPATAPYYCPSQYSPIVEEADTYSMGHWVETDPVLGDGAFSSPGKDGFYPWIDSSKTYYGIVARNDDTGSEVGYSSLVCGREIRKAYLTGVQQK